MPPLKSQRTVTKEKYSPKTKSFSQDVSSVPIKVLQPLKDVKKRTVANGNLCKYLLLGIPIFSFIQLNVNN